MTMIWPTYDKDLTKNSWSKLWVYILFIFLGMEDMFQKRAVDFPLPNCPDFWTAWVSNKEAADRLDDLVWVTRNWDF